MTNSSTLLETSPAENSQPPSTSLHFRVVKLLHLRKRYLDLKTPSFPTLSWSVCRKALLTFTLLVALFTLLFIIFHQRSLSPFRRRFPFTSNNKNKPIDSSRVKRLCKQLRVKESINWSYFYYYEDLPTKKSLVWCKVPKAGSTSLTKMFLRLAGRSTQEISNSTRIHKLLRTHYPRLSSKVMMHRIRSSKTFLVVRDPFERLLSAYRDKLESYQRDLEYRDGFYWDHYGRFMIDKTGGRNTTQKEPTFSEFVQYLIRTPVGRFDEHWMPITRLCSPCRVDYNMIIKLEHFSEVRKPLAYAKIDPSFITWSHKTGTSNRKILASYFRNISLPDMKKLYSKYKRDFQLFGYSPNKYFKMFEGKGASNSTDAKVSNSTQKIKS